MAVILLHLLTTHSSLAQQVQHSVDIKKIYSMQVADTAFFTFNSAIPVDFAARHLPFFCDKEYKLEKWTKIPFRFRLGSVEYCDKMEGKRK